MPRMLLKSWAMPLARTPMASSLSARCNSASMAFFFRGQLLGSSDVLDVDHIVQGVALVVVGQGYAEHDPDGLAADRHQPGFQPHAGLALPGHAAQVGQHPARVFGMQIGLLPPDPASPGLYYPIDGTKTGWTPTACPPGRPPPCPPRNGQRRCGCESAPGPCGGYVGLPDVAA